MEQTEYEKFVAEINLGLQGYPITDTDAVQKREIAYLRGVIAALVDRFNTTVYVSDIDIEQAGELHIDRRIGQSYVLLSVSHAKEKEL